MICSDWFKLLIFHIFNRAKREMIFQLRFSFSLIYWRLKVYLIKILNHRWIPNFELNCKK